MEEREWGVGVLSVTLEPPASGSKTIEVTVSRDIHARPIDDSALYAILPTPGSYVIAFVPTRSSSKYVLQVLGVSYDVTELVERNECVASLRLSKLRLSSENRRRRSLGDARRRLSDPCTCA